MSEFICFFLLKIFQGFVGYLTIVSYSMYKSVEEEYRRNQLCSTISDTNQDIGLQIKNWWFWTIPVVFKLSFVFEIIPMLPFQTLKVSILNCDELFHKQEYH